MKQKKWFSAAALLLLAVSVSACGSKPAEMAPTDPPTGDAVTDAPVAAEVQTEAETESETSAVASAEQIKAALAGTVWSGVNGKDGAFAVGFGEKEITYAAQDGSVTEGFWDISPDGSTLQICSDEAMTAEVRSMPFYYNTDKNVLELEDQVYMVNIGAESREAASAEAAKLGTAVSFYTQKLRDVYWGGGDENYALIFSLSDDGTCDMHYYDAMDGVINETTFFWGMSSDTICFYNEDYNPVMYFTWTAEGDTFTLSDHTTEANVACTQLTPEEAQDVSYQLGVLAGAYEPGGAADADGGYEE